MKLGHTAGPGLGLCLCGVAVAVVAAAAVAFSSCLVAVVYPLSCVSLVTLIPSLPVAAIAAAIAVPLSLDSAVIVATRSPTPVSHSGPFSFKSSLRVTCLLHSSLSASHSPSSHRPLLLCPPLVASHSRPAHFALRFTRSRTASPPARTTPRPALIDQVHHHGIDYHAQPLLFMGQEQGPRVAGRRRIRFTFILPPTSCL